MIYEPLTFIVQQLNRAFSLRFGDADQRAVLSNMVNTDGSAQEAAENRVAVSLVNLEQETVNRSGFNKRLSGGSGTSVRATPDVSMNLYVLIAANFPGKNYSEGLKYLSEVVSFFQAHVVFDQRNAPELPESVEKLIFEIVNLKMHDLSHLWSSMGAKYAPSILYKVRMITFSQNQIQTEIPAISGLRGDNHAAPVS